MNPLFFSFVSITIGILFFILIPGFGAVGVRSAWRKFRMQIVAASLYPTISSSVAGTTTKQCYFRFIGLLESIQGEGLLWLSDGQITVGVEVADIRVFLLSSFSLEEEPQILSWNHIYSLTAGTRVFVAGRFHLRGANRMLKSDSEQPLTVVIFDVDDKLLMRTSIGSGRGRNEYWNQFTSLSLLTGSVILIILAFFASRLSDMRLPVIVSMTVAASPVLPLLPPGIGFFLLYRFLWKRARLLRTERDLFRLPLRYFKNKIQDKNSNGILPDGEHYVMRKESEISICDRSSPAFLSSSIIKTSDLKDANSYVFGTIKDADKFILSSPNDPLADLLKVKGNPAEVSQKASLLAARSAIWAALALAAAVSVNFGILFILFALVIK